MTKRNYVWTKPVVPPHERILARIETPSPDACWLWPGAYYEKPSGRYGMIRTGSRQDGTRTVRQTHVVMWEYVHGPVPEGLQLDHLCRVTLCCNPHHLEPVTGAVNCQRKPYEVRRRSIDAMTRARQAKAAKKRAVQ